MRTVRSSSCIFVWFWIVFLSFWFPFHSRFELQKRKWRKKFYPMLMNHQLQRLIHLALFQARHSALVPTIPLNSRLTLWMKSKRQVVKPLIVHILIFQAQLCTTGRNWNSFQRILLKVSVLIFLLDLRFLMLQMWLHFRLLAGCWRWSQAFAFKASRERG